MVLRVTSEHVLFKASSVSIGIMMGVMLVIILATGGSTVPTITVWSTS